MSVSRGPCPRLTGGWSPADTSRSSISTHCPPGQTHPQSCSSGSWPGAPCRTPLGWASWSSPCRPALLAQTDGVRELTGVDTQMWKENMKERVAGPTAPCLCVPQGPPLAAPAFIWECEGHRAMMRAPLGPECSCQASTYPRAMGNSLL